MVSYRLEDGVKYIEEADTLINTKYNTNIKFSKKYHVILNSLISSADVDEIKMKIINVYSLSQIKATRLLNEFIYILLRNKFIKVNNHTFDNESLNITSCVLEIIDSCNLNCKHCYKGDKNFKLLTLQQIKNISVELWDLGCGKITLTGGEIFLHPNFDEIYKYLYKKGFIIGLNTNGVFLDQHIELLKNYPPYIIEMSIYGVNDETYGEFAGDNKVFHKVENAIDLLNKFSIPLSLKGVITNSNYSYFDKIRNLAHKKKLTFRSDYVVFPQVDCGINTNKEQISVEKVIKHLKKMENAEKYFIKKHIKPKEFNTNIFKCRQKSDSIFITTKKDVCICACMQMETQKYKRMHLKDCILELRKIYQKQCSKKNKCNSCRLFNICRYCPAKFYLETGDYENPPHWYCELSKAIYENFIEGFHMIAEDNLQLDIANSLAGIEAGNMANLGLEISDGDKELWITSLKDNIAKGNTNLYVGYMDGNLCCFVTIYHKDDGLWLSEFEIAEKYKNTKVVIRMIEKLMEVNYLKDYTHIYFKINKTNTKSQKTFEHLGAKMVKENEKSFTYSLSKNDVANYLVKLNSKH